MGARQGHEPMASEQRFAVKHATHEKSSATPGIDMVFFTGAVGADAPPGVGDFDYEDPLYSVPADIVADG